jgi:hypothetical protein
MVDELEAEVSRMATPEWLPSITPLARSANPLSPVSGLARPDCLVEVSALARVS